MEHMKLVFIAPVVLWIAAGALICWLVLVTVKQEVAVKSAVAEFVIVGGLGLYLAMSLIFYFFIPAVTGMHLQLSPRWLPFDRNLITITLGGILFGYELLMFITRIVSCRKKTILLESKQEYYNLNENNMAMKRPLPATYFVSIESKGFY